MDKGDTASTLKEPSLCDLKVDIKSKGLSDFVGYKEIKEKLKTLVVFPFIHEDLFENVYLVRRFLIFGPQSIGKTLLVQAIAAEADASLHILNADNILPFKNGTERKLNKLISQVKKAKKATILCIENIDLLYASEAINDVKRRFKLELMHQLENIENESTSHGIIICTTNRPWKLDSGMIGRFQEKIYLPMPDEHDRRDMLIALSKKRSCKLSGFFEQLVEKTEGYSYSDIETAMEQASLKPLYELAHKKTWVWDHGKIKPTYHDSDNLTQNLHYCSYEQLPQGKVEIRPLTLGDFNLHFSEFVRKITKQEVQMFENFLNGQKN